MRHHFYSKARGHISKTLIGGKMNAQEKNMASIRGEALAARLLATLAIETALRMAANPADILKAMSRVVDDSLNMSGPAKGDNDDEVNTMVREIARLRVNEILDELLRGTKRT